MNENYEFKTLLRNNEIKFRKWKVKDRRKYLEGVNAKDSKIIGEALVYDCLENKDIALTMNEYRYILLKIRNATMGSRFDFNFMCTKCNKEFSVNEDLNEFMLPISGDYGILTSDNITIKMGPIKAKELFLEYIKDAKNLRELEIIEFIFQIESINGYTEFTFEEANNFIDELDYNNAYELLKQWKTMLFDVNIYKEETCPHCGKTDDYAFDKITEFYPNLLVG